MRDVPITPALVAEHGLSADEYARIERLMGRAPNLTELGVFSAMWNEHCSYKSSRVWLRRLPTEAPWVICGPGENAGVVDIGDGQAAVFKMESHNHPSFIEPYQGAATGVGGILRDVFTMGARPVASLDALRFGAPGHPRTRHLVAGVVAGIGGYGNCVGVPTVGGSCAFDAAYDGNILVNAMTVGVAPADRIFRAAAANAVGHPVVYVGAKTGRDGIHGATMASAAFGEETEEKRPTVQVGDPFTEKLLMEACLALMETDAIVAIQDMGAAGLTCSSVEMADKGDAGIELDLDRVPVRESAMTPYEIMLSESQERMLMVIRPDAAERARAVFETWGVDFAVVGRVTDTGRLVLKAGGAVVGDLPVRPLVDQAPVYERAYVLTPRPAPLAGAPAGEAAPAPAPMEALQRLLAAPDLCSKRWIWEQYDHMVMADTVQPPGGDAAVVRVHGTGKGLALTADCTPRYCAADPASGGAQAVAEAWRNLTAVGARPLAITDCLNFGNPERAEVMGQFVGCIEGMAQACLALDFPVVSGNVSFYNETGGAGILPTPSIGGVGLIADLGLHVHHGLQGARRGAAADRRRRRRRPSRPLPLPARDRGPGGGAPAGRRPRRRAAPRRFRAPPDRERAPLRLPRHLRRRPAGGPRRDGARRPRLGPQRRRPHRPARRRGVRRRLALRRGPGALSGQRARGGGRGAGGRRRGRGGCGLGHRHNHWRACRRDGRAFVDSGGRRCHIDSSAPPHP